MQAIKVKVAQLGKNPDTRDDSIRLKVHLDNCLLASQLRPEKVQTLPKSELLAILTKMQDLKFHYTLAVRVGILDHTVADMSDRAETKDLIKVLRPWSPEELQGSAPAFLPLAPSLAMLTEMPLNSRIAKFRSQFWSRIMTPMVMSSSAGQMESLAKACEWLEESYGNEDPLMLETSAAALMQEVLCSARAIKALSESNYDTSADEDIMALVARRGKTDKAITTSTANAAFANPVLGERLELYVKARTIILEMGETLVSHRTAILDLDPDIAGFKKLTQILLDLGKVKASAAAPLYDDFSEEVMATCTNTWALLEEALGRPDSTPSSEMLSVLGEFAAEAVVVFSLEPRVSLMQGSISDLIKAASGVARTKELRLAVLASWVTPFTDPGCADELQKCLRTLAAHEGIPVPPDIHIGLAEMVDSFAQEFIKGFSDQPDLVLLRQGLPLWHKLLGVSEAKRASHKCVVAAADALLLMLESEAKASALSEENFHKKSEAMSVAGAAIAKAVAAVDLCRIREASDLTTLLLETAGTHISKCKAASDSYLMRILRSNLSKLKEISEKCQSISNGFEVRGPENIWFSSKCKGTSPQAWKNCVAEAQATVMQVDTKALSEELVNMEKQLKATADALEVAPARDGDEVLQYEAAKLKHRDYLILLSTSLLMHTMTTDADPETVRKRVQVDIKRLRSNNIMEKDILPDPLTKKVIDVLVCKAG